MIQDFNISIDTKFVFGKGAENKVGEELKQLGISTVLILHDSGKFLLESGLLDRIYRSLENENIRTVELGGILPNPRLSTVEEGIAFAWDEGVDFLLAVGGGSVIDTAKAIGIGVKADRDVWEFFTGEAIPTETLPVGAVVTYPSAGSESSAVTVINNVEKGEKLLICNPIVRPKLAFMNPELTYSLPKFLTACGVVDMFSHICERYFSPDEGVGVIDRMAEGALKTIVEVGPKTIADPANYENRGELMWLSTLAQNNTFGIGRTQDWSTHEIGNELSALYDTPHGATISIIMPSWMRYVYKKAPERFARFAREVFGVMGCSCTLTTAEEGIVKTEEFFKKLGMPTCFKDFDIPEDGVEEMLDRIAFCGEDASIGGIVRLNREDCREIYKMAFA